MIEKKNNNEVDVKIKFNYKDVEKKFADIALKPFESKGKKFIKFVYAKVSDLKVISKNPSRKNVITGGDITEIEEIIKKNQYVGWGHVPPVVNLLGELIAGHHRYWAHKGTDEEYMWVAICDFDDEKSEYVYNRLENQEASTFAKKVSSNDDLIVSTHYGIEKGFINKDEDSIKNEIETYKKSKADRRFIFETVLKELGIKIDQHLITTREEIFTEYKKEKKKDLDFVSSNVDKGDNILNNPRLLKGVGYQILKGNDMYIALKVSNTIDVKDLNDERDRLVKEMGSKYLLDFANKIINQVGQDSVKTVDNKIGKVYITFVKQYDSDKWTFDVEAENA